MKIEITTLNYQASDKLKDIVTKKVMRLERYFDEDISAKVLMKREKDSEKLELTIFLKGSVLRAETAGDNMYNNIDDVLPKIERQIHKHKTRLQKRVKSFDDSMLFVQEKVEEREEKVVKKKELYLKPMSEEEAITEMDLVGHDFYIFLNEKTDKVNVLYRRKGNGIGLIEVSYN